MEECSFLHLGKISASRFVDSSHLEWWLFRTVPVKICFLFAFLIWANTYNLLVLQWAPSRKRVCGRCLVVLLSINFLLCNDVTNSWLDDKLPLAGLQVFLIEVTLFKETQSSSFSLITRKMKFRKMWAFIAWRPLTQTFKYHNSQTTVQPQICAQINTQRDTYTSTNVKNM